MPPICTAFAPNFCPYVSGPTSVHMHCLYPHCCPQALSLPHCCPHVSSLPILLLACTVSVPLLLTYTVCPHCSPHSLFLSTLLPTCIVSVHTTANTTLSLPTRLHRHTATSHTAAQMQCLPTRLTTHTVCTNTTAHTTLYLVTDYCVNGIK